MTFAKMPSDKGIYIMAFFFNVGVSLTLILIPLYGLFLGYSASLIGILLSIPGIAQISLRIFAGILSDHFGEKWMLFATFSGLLAAGLIFSFTYGFWGLATAQFLMGVARTIYWPTTQSYASRIPDLEAPKVLGRLTGFVYIGQLLGFSSAGWIVASLGYFTAFNIIMVAGGMGLLMLSFLPAIPRSFEASKEVSLKEIPATLKQTSIVLAIVNAFLAGIAYSIASSFFPVWLEGLGYKEGTISLIFSLKLIGSVIAGTIYGNILKKMSLPLLLQLSLLVAGALFFLLAVADNTLQATIIHLLFGFCSGLLVVSYQVLGVRSSSD